MDMLAEDSASPTKEQSKSIQVIDKTTVHRICSGQVVLNLATAVKELVENSLDAGSTSVEVKLKEYGSELVEIIDNGHGVAEQDFQALTLKHHTSKLQDFSDLIQVQTYGFRGEALSSLCALSKLVIVTRHENASTGTKLEYDHNGIIIKQTPCARQVGTSVALSNLFTPLPVRRKEFLRNLKREFARMTNVLYAYCLVLTGVRITCTHQHGKGSRSTIVSTSASQTVKENISSIFGPKQLQTLVEFQQQIPDDSMVEEFGLRNKTKPEFVLTGFISMCAHGSGRSSKDRQFYFVNSRPCDLSKVSKVVNEVYHQFNRHQNPFVVLNIKLPRDSVDVNVTPDKRQVFLESEKWLLATVKASLLKMFEGTPSVLEVQNIQSPVNDRITTHENDSSPSSSRMSLTEKFASATGSPFRQHKTILNDSIPSPSSLKRTGSFVNTQQSKQPRLDSFFQPANRKRSSILGFEKGKAVEGFSSKASSSKDFTNFSVDDTKETEPVEDINVKPSSDDTFQFGTGSDDSTEEEVEADVTASLVDSNPFDAHSSESGFSDLTSEINDSYQSASQSSDFAPENNDRNTCPVIDDVNHLPAKDFKRESHNLTRKTVNVSFSIQALQKRITERKRTAEKDGIIVRKFRAKIAPTDNKAAENELKKEISKDMFEKMQIVGQFNLGFIVTHLGSDLFIIDQHATDEKYNYETLQRQTDMQTQRLIVPLSLELPAVSESTLMENISIFKKNGFDFSINEAASATKRIQLTKIPTSRNWNFGKEDIDQMLFMLQESPGVMCRPSRIHDMFASRACRKSVMIGTALSNTEMKRLVKHMAEIDHPWNCPHGRPTMRHLINLAMLPE